jgi:hypothetical protein
MHVHTPSRTLSMGAIVCSGLASLLVAAAAAAPAAAESDLLAGTWRGGGTVTYNSGSTEHARCRATVIPSGKAAYDINATCATQSGTVSQQAFVRGRGNSYRGTFYNASFDATGKISISVSGRSSTVRLISTKGSAVLRLSR